jgi:CRISPR type I-D-associated protein Csc2
MESITPYLGDINHLVDTSISSDGKKTYVHPAFKNLGSVSIVVIREVIAPVVFRNAEEEITDIDVGDAVHVRAVANKFKFIERGRGLQVLRAYGVGGRMPQNKTAFAKTQKISEGFDLNTLVFGDSAMRDNNVCPVKASVNYSDALSIAPKFACVDESFHNRAAEDGTLFDAESEKNSSNLFTRHFVRPGALLVQVISTRGRCLPMEGLNHLLLSMGLAGAYGGQTSVTGTNIRTHIAGVYGDKFEQAQSSPYELLKCLKDVTSVDDAIQKIATALSAVHATSISATDAQAHQQSLIDAFVNEEAAMEQDYKNAAPKVAELFDEWFGSNTSKKKA